MSEDDINSINEVFGFTSVNNIMIEDTINNNQPLQFESHQQLTQLQYQQIQLKERQDQLRLRQQQQQIEQESEVEVDVEANNKRKAKKKVPLRSILGKRRKKIYETSKNQYATIARQEKEEEGAEEGDEGQPISIDNTNPSSWLESRDVKYLDNIIKGIDLIYMKNLTKTEIRAIAKSLGVTIYHDKKLITCNKIKAFIANHNLKKLQHQKFQDQQAHQYQLQQTKSFNNSSSFYDLPNKEIQYEEELFWRIFRNIVLFRKIIQYLSISIYASSAPNHYDYIFSRSLKYDQIIHVSWILDSNYFKLLEYKVKCGDLLLFNHHSNHLNSHANTLKLFKKIFKFINDGGDDHHESTLEFYRLLFKPNGNYYRFIFDKQNKINLETIVSLSIKEKNLTALKVLFEDCYYIPTLNYSLSMAIKSGSLKVVKLVISIVQYYQQQQLQIQQQYNMSSIDDLETLDFNIFTEFNNPSIKILNYLTEELKLFSFANISNLIQSDPILVNNNTKKLSNNKYLSIFNCLTLKELINSCILIIKQQNVQKYYLSQHQDNVIINQQDLETKSIKLSSLIDSIEEIDFITSQFSKKELSLKLKTIINFQLRQPENQSDYYGIKRLVELYLSVNRNLKTYCYFNYKIMYGDDSMNEFNDENSNNSNINNNNNNNNNNNTIKYNYKITQILDSHHFKQSLKYGSYGYWLDYNQDVEIKYPFISNYYKKNKSYPNILFKYVCKEDKEKQLKFIQQISSNSSSFDRLLLFYLVVENDDLDLLKLAVQKIPSISDLCQITKNTSVAYYLKIQRFIRSLEMLEYCYDQFPSHFYIPENYQLLDFYGFQDVELLKRHDQLLHGGDYFSSNCSYLNINNNTTSPSFLSTSSSNLDSMISNVTRRKITFEKGFNFRSSWGLNIYTYSEYLKILVYIIQDPYGFYNLITDDSFLRSVKLQSPLYADYDGSQFSLFKESILEDFQFILEHTNLNYYPGDMFEHSLHLKWFLDWVFEFRKDDVTLNKSKTAKQQQSLINTAIAQYTTAVFDEDYHNVNDNNNNNNNYIAPDCPLRCKLDPNSLNTNSILYRAGRIDKILEKGYYYDNSLEVLAKIMPYGLALVTDAIGKYGDVVSLEKYIQKCWLPLLHQQQYSDLLSDREERESRAMLTQFQRHFSSLLTFAAIYGRLNIFQHLFYNHQFLMKKKSKIYKDGFLPLPTYRNIIIQCHHFCHFHILDFISNVIGYTFRL